MKRKITVILLILTLMLTMVACGNGNDGNDGNGNGNDAGVINQDTDNVELEIAAFDAYTEIMRRLSLEDVEQGAFDIDFVMDMNMSMLGEHFSTVSEGSIKMMVDGNEARMAMTMITDMAMLGLPPMVLEMYVMTYDNEFVEFSMVMDGEDISAMLPPEMLGDMAGDMVDNVLGMPEFDMDAFRSVEIEQVGGNTVINMVLQGEELSEFIMQTMEDELAMLDVLGLEMNFDFSDIVMTIVADSNNNPISMTMDMEMRMSFGGDLEGELEELADEEMIIHVVTVYTFNGFGEDVQIAS